MVELVRSTKNGIVTDSYILMEKFSKKHEYIIRKTEQLIKRLGARKVAPKNEPVLIEGVKEYRGQKFKYFTYDRKAFSLLVMSFTGDKAFEWQEKFYDAFAAMEKALLNQTSLEWKQQREQGKLARKEETDTIQKFVELAKSQGSKGAKWYYTHFTNATYRALQLIEHKKPRLRDTLDMMELNQLILAENIAMKSIESNMEAGEHYKVIFVNVKNDIEKFASTLFLDHIKQIGG